MRPLAVLPALCALAALILSLLCLFAGSNKGFLQNGEIVTVNTSRLGHGQLFDTSDGDGSLISSLGNDIESDLNGLLGNATSDIAKAIGVHDFYKMHVMTYCDGFFKGDATEKNPGENVTFCSKITPLLNFNLTNAVSQDLVQGANLVDIHWPDQIQHEVKLLKVAVRAMFVFYCLAIAFAGICLLTSLLGIFGGGRLSALANFSLFSLGFLCIVIASIISTVIGVKFTHIVNKYGEDIGVSASKGSTFLGMTWTATILMGLGAMVWIFECIIGRRRQKTYVEKA